MTFNKDLGRIRTQVTLRDKETGPRQVYCLVHSHATQVPCKFSFIMHGKLSLLSSWIHVGKPRPEFVTDSQNLLLVDMNKLRPECKTAALTPNSLCLAGMEQL